MKTRLFLFFSIILLFACCKPNKKEQSIPTNKISSKPIIDCHYTFKQAIAGCNAPQYITNQLVLLNVNYLSTDGKLHQGQILINKAIETDIKYMFDFMLKQRFPIAHAIPIVKYNWNDDASMLDNNTSCFCYRNIGFSLHAKGLAVDINPFFNPVIWKPGWKRINKPQGAVYSPNRAGTFTPQHPVVLEFENRHFHWGGKFSAKYDYHHFEKAGYWKPKNEDEIIDTASNTSNISTSTNISDTIE